MKKTLATLFLLWYAFFAQAQYLEDIRSTYTYPFDTRNFSIGIDQYGQVRYVTLFGEQALTKEVPVAVAFKDGKAYPASYFECNFDVATIGFEGEVDHISLNMDVDYDGNSISVTVAYVDWEKGPDAVLLFPICLNLTERVGDAIGVAQGRGLAFGMQALNTKANAGFPANCTQQVSEMLHYDADPELAAKVTPESTHMQFSAYDRLWPHIRDTYGHEGALAYNLDFPEGSINDASLMLFACRQEDVMGKLAKIEVQEGLAHPVDNGIWNKVDPLSSKSYLCNEYDAKDAAFVSEKCRQAGLDMPRYVLANRITATAPLNIDNLLKQGELKLQLPLDATQTEFAVYHSGLFNQPAYLNVLLIDEELVTYRSQETIGNIHVFYGCTRGAFGTKKAAHRNNAFTFKLWDHPDHTLVPTPEAQDQMVSKEAKKCAKSDAPILIFNDLKSYAYNGLDDWAITRMLDTMQSHNPGKMLQADQLTHGSWHYLTRVNDNTLWNIAQRNTMAETLAGKQAYYRGNLMPWMIGNFQIHLADKYRKATTLEELEWFLSNAAAFDAGFGLDFSAETMRKHGITDAMLNTINIWESLRLAGAFSEAQKEAFKDPYGNWHIEKGNDAAYLLYPLHISRGYLCNLSDDNWQWNSPYASRFALRIEVEGKGSISELEIRTPNGILYLPCTLKARQCLVYNFDGTAYITDANYKTIKEVEAQGVSRLDEGTSEVTFRCETKKEENKTPQVTVRFFTRGDAERITR